MQQLGKLGVRVGKLRRGVEIDALHDDGIGAACATAEISEILNAGLHLLGLPTSHDAGWNFLCVLSALEPRFLQKRNQLAAMRG